MEAAKRFWVSLFCQRVLDGAFEQSANVVIAESNCDVIPDFLGFFADRKTSWGFGLGNQNIVSGGQRKFNVLCRYEFYNMLETNFII